jgi:hypothetical protein
LVWLHRVALLSSRVLIVHGPVRLLVRPPNHPSVVGLQRKTLLRSSPRMEVAADEVEENDEDYRGDDSVSDCRSGV